MVILWYYYGNIMVLSSNSLRKKNVQANDYDYIYLVCDYAIKKNQTR